MVASSEQGKGNATVESAPTFPRTNLVRSSFTLRAMLRADLQLGLPTAAQLISQPALGVYRTNYEVLEYAFMYQRNLSQDEASSERNIAYLESVFESLIRVDNSSEIFARQVLGLMGIHEETVREDYVAFNERHRVHGGLADTILQLTTNLANTENILRATRFLARIKFFKLLGDDVIANAIEACLETEACKGEEMTAELLEAKDNKAELAVIGIFLPSSLRNSDERSYIEVLRSQIEEALASATSDSRESSDKENDEEFDDPSPTNPIPVVGRDISNLVFWEQLSARERRSLGDHLDAIFPPEE